jgi:hypothetical protein
MARPSRVSTGTLPEQQRTYLDATTFLCLNTAVADTKVVLTGRITLGTTKDLDERLSSPIRSLLGLGGEARDAVTTPEASERRLRSHVVWQRIHEVRQCLVADVRRRGSHHACS